MSTETSRAQTKVYVNWKQLDEQIKKSGKSKAEICRRIARSEGYLQQLKRSGNGAPESVITLLCELYNWDFDAITRKDDEPKPRNELQVIVERFDIIEKQIKEIYNCLQNSKTEESDMLTKPEKAVILLKQMTFGNGSCEQTDFIAKAAQMGLSAKLCEHAIKFTQSKIITKGYGQNKTRWIVRE